MKPTEWMVTGFTDSIVHPCGMVVSPDSPSATTLAICKVLPEGSRGSVLAYVREDRASYTKQDIGESQWKKSLGIAHKIAAAPVMEAALEEALASMEEAKAGISHDTTSVLRNLPGVSHCLADAIKTVKEALELAREGER
jgi:hypothetical protein